MLLLGGLQLRFSWTTIQFLAWCDQLPDASLPLSENLDLMRDYAKLSRGDRILAIGQEPVSSRGQFARAYWKLQVDETVNVRVLRGGQPIDVPHKVKYLSGKPELPIAIAITTLNILTPGLCLLFAFFVAFQRPLDPLSWWLLALMFGISNIASANAWMVETWPPALSVPAIFLRGIGLFIAPAAWVWFGLNFPDPSSPRRLANQLRWPLTLGLIVLALPSGLGSVMAIHWPGRNMWLRQTVDEIPSLVFYGFISAAVLLGFCNQFYKLYGETRPDSLRRMRLLISGIGIGIAPYATLLVRSWITGKEFGSVPEFVWIPSLMAMLIIPAAFAYVVVVQRAMDVQVAIRQGLQYAMARRGLDFLRLALAVSIAWLVFTLGAEGMSIHWPKVLAALTALAVLLYLFPIAGRWLDRRFFRESVNVEHVLTRLSERVRTMMDASALMETVTGQIKETMYVTRVGVFLRDGNGNFVGADGRVPADGGIAGQLQRGSARVYFDRPGEWLASLPDAEAALLRRSNSELLVPIRGSDSVTGYLDLGAKRSEQPYSNADVRLLETVAAQTGLALENARLSAAVVEQTAQRELLHREIEIARDVQSRLLPKRRIAVPGLDYFGLCRPAQLVGGDTFDVLETPGGQFGFAIGDVAGKGIPAALLMSNLQASLRGLNFAAISNLGELLTKLNRLVYDSTPSNRFATFFYCLYDGASQRITYSSAGHNPALLLRAEANTVVPLRTKGVGLGLKREAEFEEASTSLRPGDLLLLYTDGLTEAVNAQREEFGEDRLAQSLIAARHSNAPELAQELLHRVDQFADGAPQHDDMTLIVIRALP